jgi:integrase
MPFDMSGSLSIPSAGEGPRRSVSVTRTFSLPEEFQRLAEQLSVHDRAMVLLAGSTGLRRSEMIALTWSDLDARTMEVNVLRTSVCNRFGNTKTESSRRRVPLQPIVLNALLDWRAESLYATEADFLFPSIRLNGSSPLIPDSLLKRSIRPALVQAGTASASYQ